MKKNKSQKMFKRITVLIPEKGSFPNFLRMAVELSKMLKISLRLLVSSRFLNERPQKSGFYREYMEEQSLQNGLTWDVQVFEDSLSRVLEKFSREEDILVALKDNDPFLLKVLLREAPCPVLVSPQGFECSFQTVILAYAGGRFSDRALRIASELGKNGGCCLEVLTVGVASSPVLRSNHEHVRYCLGMYKVKADYRMLRGNIKKTILDTCEGRQANLLILGSSETPEWKDYRFRSLSEEVADEAKCPVMVVK